MKKTTEVVHELSINDQSFGLIVEAIRRLSIQRSKFVKFKDVILNALKSCDIPSDAGVEHLKDLSPLEGDIRVYVRLTAEENAEVERLKTDLNAMGFLPCGVRETMIFCALFVADPEHFACNSTRANRTL